jgi:predicted RNase H-like HicB family nuclease
MSLDSKSNSMKKQGAKQNREDRFNMTIVDTRTEAARCLKMPYSRVLIPDGDGYSAEILEFPGCYSQGDTAQEALANVEEAATNWIEANLDAGRPIPAPATDSEYAGKVALRLPRSIHRQAVRMAERDGTSLNQWLVTAIAARVGAEELYSRIAQRCETLFINTAHEADNRFSKVVASIEPWGWLNESSNTSVDQEGESSASTPANAKLTYS